MVMTSSSCLTDIFFLTSLAETKRSLKQETAGRRSTTLSPSWKEVLDTMERVAEESRGREVWTRLISLSQRGERGTVTRE